jgi:FkbM family methyltransferase
MDGEINLDWIVENFNKESFTFFEIGLAGIQQSMSFELKKRIPKGKYCTFEAAEYWHDLNEEIALKHKINYYKYAVCDIDGEVLFYPSLTQNGQVHTLSSSIFELYKGPHCNTFGKEYGEPYMVNSIKLETFCRENNITPDFIHIDVEGAELKVLSNMGKYKPKCIWTEICGFAHYDTKTSIDEFNSFMESIGYYLVYVDPEFTTADALYCLNEFEITSYK